MHLSVLSTVIFRHWSSLGKFSVKQRCTVRGRERQGGAGYSEGEGEREPGRRGTWAGIERDLDAHPGDCWWFPSLTPGSWSPRVDTERRC